MSLLQGLKNLVLRWSGLLLVALLLVMDPVTGAATPALHPLFEQALEASRQGDFQAALPLWDEFLELAPEQPAAWSNRGKKLIPKR